MDLQVIEECTALSLAERITFPEVVLKLAEAGVERYIADLTSRRKYSYGRGGETYTDALPFNGPEIPARFDAAAVADTIKRVQQGRIQYREFLRDIMKAGCSHYEVFITGRQVIYFGRDGSQHIERFTQTA